MTEWVSKGEGGVVSPPWDRDTFFREKCISKHLLPVWGWASQTCSLICLERLDWRHWEQVWFRMGWKRRWRTWWEMWKNEGKMIVDEEKRKRGNRWTRDQSTAGGHPQRCVPVSMCGCVSPFTQLLCGLASSAWVILLGTFKSCQSAIQLLFSLFTTRAYLSLSLYLSFYTHSALPLFFL